MALMSAELYDALKEAGASEEKARKAAEAVAAFDQRFSTIDKDLSVLKWMVGTNIALTITLMWKVFTA
ncbi:MAG TPA: integrase [Candidatus Tectomicrobia bacterium]|nr:integrase [Candidatus Tectomicrobia bacterium]